MSEKTVSQSSAAAPEESFNKLSIFTKSAYHFVLLIGLVSLFSDLTYEGARSIIGPYLGILGASAAAVGFVAGLGEFLGYALRLLSGYLTDKFQRYWVLVFIGYPVNLFAVAALALVGRWELAAVLVVVERMGKAIRTPARDAMLSHATQLTGRGWGFGLHEAMDQIGAVLGPLLIWGILSWKSNYRIGFASLFFPAVVAVSILGVARFLFPRPRAFETFRVPLHTQGLPRRYWFYILATVFVALGYADFPLIAFHVQQKKLLAPAIVPLLYALAMGVDAVAALLAGRWYDKIGSTVLIVSVGLAAFFAPLVFLTSGKWIWLGMMLWGAGMGVQESVLRALIADLVPPHRRGTGYGIFNTFFGFSWFLGSTLMGFLYQISLFWLVTFSVLIQWIAAILLTYFHLRFRTTVS